MRRFRRRKDETEEEKEERRRRVLAILDDDKTFIKIQDLHFSDQNTLVVDDNGEYYFDKEPKKALEGGFRIYKCFEVWTLDRMVDAGLDADRAMTILGAKK